MQFSLSAGIYKILNKHLNVNGMLQCIYICCGFSVILCSWLPRIGCGAVMRHDSVVDSGAV